MKLLNDGIHNCRECKIYKECGEPCSLQPELQIPSCQYCDTRMCCRSPALVLMECEQNTILDKIDDCLASLISSLNMSNLKELFLSRYGDQKL